MVSTSTVSFCVALPTPLFDVCQTTIFRTWQKFVEHRTSWRGESEPPGCWERAGVKRQPSPSSLEARIRPSWGFVAL
eukprot:15465780-Alexandrium_andersonii.AAC.1